MNTAKFTAAISLILSLGCVASVLAAQTGTLVINATVNQITSVHATGTPAALSLQAPSTGGTVPGGGSDSNSYLLYTSTVTGAGTHRITAAIGAPLPTGVQLRLQATAPAGNKVGTVGTPSPALSLSTTAQNLITGIGACYTGTSAGDGARLNYQLGVSNWTTYKAFAATSVTVTFTMTN
jgi:hypothetical protein